MKKSSTYYVIRSFFFSTLVTITVMTIAFIVFSHFFSITLHAVLENSKRSELTNINEITIDVSDTLTLDSISDLLVEESFISNKYLFLIESKLRSSFKLQEGSYTITNTMSNSEILDALSPVVVTTAINEVRLMIPEGSSVVEIAERVAALGIVSEEAFLEAANKTTYDYDFLKDIPEGLAYPLEGYLFPDTYFLYSNSSAEAIVIKLLNQFEAVTSKYTQYLASSGYTLHDLVTIASIIEEEAAIYEERPTISGVIYNRLNASMNLQMCSTVQYALEKRKATLSLDDLATPSPYNTYMNQGLPIGPICAPGEQSLKAAFMPDTHPYLFFVLSDANDGSHVFTSTNEEHAYYKDLYNQNDNQNFID